MSESKRNLGGAPKGNQNARIHGFYSCQLSEMERKDLAEACLLQDVDTEIAIVRLKIRNLLVFDPENVKLIFLANASLTNLLRTRDRLYDARKEGEDDFDRHVIENGFGARGFILPDGYLSPLQKPVCDYGITPVFNPWSGVGDI